MAQPARAAFVGAFAAALITLPGLGAGTLWDNSETAYSEVAREILLRGDWLVMHFNGQPWYVQPPLYFWIAAAFAHVFGITSLAFRLPAALATIVMGGLTGYAVARQTSTRAGAYASIILSTCLMQAVIGRLAIMDALLDLTVALGVLWWFRALECGRDRYFVYGCVALAFGLLVKGPVAPVIALLVVVPYAIWNDRAEPVHWPSLRAIIAGCALGVAIVVPWFLAIAAHAGFHAVGDLIGHYTIGRYTGVIENQSGPVWYYLPVVVLGFFPWVAFLPMATILGLHRLRSPRTSENVARLWRLAFTWAIVPLLFFSLAKTKLPNYIALEFPAFALLVALYFEDVVRRGTSRAAVASAITVPLFIGLIAVAIALFVRDNRLTKDALALRPDLVLMGATIFSGAVLTAVLLGIRSTVAVAPYALAVATALAMDILAVVALPNAEAFKPIPHLAPLINAHRRSGDLVAIQDFRGFNALMFYTKPPVEILRAQGSTDPAGGSDPRATLCANARVWLVGARQRPADDPTFGRVRTVEATWGNAALFLYSGPGCR